MLRPVVLVALMIAVPAFAGCVDEEPGATAVPPADAASMPAPPLARVGVEACEETAAIWPVSPEDARRFVPEGFVARGIVGAGMDDRLPALQLITAVCRPDAQTPLAFETVSLATAWILVRPPAKWVVDGINDYAVAPWTLVSEGGVADVLNAWGMPTHAGELSFTPVVSPVLRVDSVVMEDEGFSATLTVETPARSTKPDHAPLRIFTFTDGDVTGAIDVDGGSHPHWEYGHARLLTQGPVPFPVPVGAGVGVHGFDGPLIFTRVPFEALQDAAVHE